MWRAGGAAVARVPRGDGGAMRCGPTPRRIPVGVWYLWLVVQGPVPREAGERGTSAAARRTVARPRLRLVD
jgi:hypothetical protein